MNRDDHIEPKVIENGVIVPPGLQIGEMTLAEHQDYLAWVVSKPRLSRAEAIAVHHRPKDVYAYFGPLPEELPAVSPEVVEQGPVIEATAIQPRADTELRNVRGEARSLGYTGDVCINCGSTRMVKNGSCLLCQECGSTTGCS